MICELCNKRLSRKTARKIDGVVVCSTCLFKPPKQREPKEPPNERE